MIHPRTCELETDSLIPVALRLNEGWTSVYCLVPTALSLLPPADCLLVRERSHARQREAGQKFQRRPTAGGDVSDFRLDSGLGNRRN